MHGLFGAGRRTGPVGGTSRDHQRDAGLIDQDGVGFVHHRDAQGPMHLFGARQRYLIPQIIESCFIRRGVSHGAPVGRLAFSRGHPLLDHPDVETEPRVDSAHPVRIAPRQVVVRGQDVNAISRPRVPHHGWDGRKRFAFTGLHFGNPARGQRQRALQLDVEHLQPEHPPGHDRGDREHFRERRRSAACRPELVVSELRKVGLAAPDVRDRCFRGSRSREPPAPPRRHESPSEYDTT